MHLPNRPTLTFQMQERQSQKGSREAQHERFLSGQGAFVLGVPSTVGSMVPEADRDSRPPMHL
jgi:hypothetical protein